MAKYKRFAGKYSPDTQYEAGDIVSFDGAAYYRKVPGKGVSPLTNAKFTVWSRLSDDLSTVLGLDGLGGGVSREEFDRLSEEIEELKPSPGQSYNGTVISIEESAGKAINVSAETNEEAALVHQGKNFVPSYPVATKNNGITFIGNADGTITASGTNPADKESWCWFIDHRYTGEPKRVFPPGKYTVSSTLPWGADRNVFVQKLNSSGAVEWWLNGIFSNSPKTFELTEPTVLMVSVMFTKGATVDVTFSVQIELGDNVTAFEPHKRTVYNDVYPIGVFAYEGVNVLYDENGATLSATVTTSKTDIALKGAGVAADAAITGREFQNVYAAIDVRGRTPQEYGALGNGKADDTAALQQCIDENGTMFLPAGTYRITSTLIVPGGRNIIGYGKDNTTIYCENCDAILFAKNAERGNIRSLYLKGDESDHKAITFSGNTQYWTFDDLSIRHFGGTFIYANGNGYVGGLRIQNSEFSNGGASCIEMITCAASQINTIDIMHCDITNFPNGNGINIAVNRGSIIGNTIQTTNHGINIDPSLSVESATSDAQRCYQLTIMSNYFEGIQKSYVRGVVYRSFTDDDVENVAIIDGLVILGNYGFWVDYKDTVEHPAVKFEALADNPYGYSALYPSSDSLVRNLLYCNNKFYADAGKVVIDGGNILQSDSMIYEDSSPADRHPIIMQEEPRQVYINMGNATIHGRYTWRYKTVNIRNAYIDGEAEKAKDTITLSAGVKAYLDVDNHGINMVTIPFEIINAGETTPHVQIRGRLTNGEVETTHDNGLLIHTADDGTTFIQLSSGCFVKDKPSKQYESYELVFDAKDNTVKIGNPSVKYVWGN